MRGTERQASTSGTDHAGREPRDLAPSLEVIDLAAEAVRLRSEPQWADGDRNSKTFIKSGGLRVVMTSLRAGAALDNDQPDEAVSVDVLDGLVEITAGGASVTVRPGQLATLGGGVPWRIAAAEESVVVLSVGRDDTLQAPSSV
jgi:quercetin dioxygenase-like cupin family protein